MIGAKIGNLIIGDGFQGKQYSENGCLTNSRGGRYVRRFSQHRIKTVATNDGARPYGLVPYHKVLILFTTQTRNASGSGLIDLLKDLTSQIKRPLFRQDCHVSAL